MDQTLEHNYNKPAKGAGEWLHKAQRSCCFVGPNQKGKELFVSYLENNANRATEYSIYYEFSQHSAKESSKDVVRIIDSSNKVGNTLGENFIGKLFQNL